MPPGNGHLGTPTRDVPPPKCTDKMYGRAFGTFLMHSVLGNIFAALPVSARKNAFTVFDEY